MTVQSGDSSFFYNGEALIGLFIVLKVTEYKNSKNVLLKANIKIYNINILW